MKSVQTQPSIKIMPGDDADTTGLADVRHALREFLDANLEELECEPFLKERFKAFCEGEIKIAIDSCRAKLRKLQETGPAGTKGQEELKQACRTLHMDTPRWGKPLDLVKARKLKHKLARAYHPDANRGAVTNRHLYEQVIDAFSILSMYADRYGQLK